MESLTPEQLAALQYDSAIVQQEWRLAFSRKNVEAHKPGKDATKEQKEHHGQLLVALDKMEHELKTTKEFRAFVKDEFGL